MFLFLRFFRYKKLMKSHNVKTLLLNRLLTYLPTNKKFTSSTVD